ncbi:FeoA family protein [Archaeoglobus profundus]|uniref:FeoA family protein n=1 Tax=Archaeoglobus profundus (strain DSM 5631 / JCM 9629 / NBRC 100127 / Av18) TaxID=572546 RepID=D2RG03_ARCPA|nr:FeoA family protein [Archaeoglobus profundus]ADB57228.1 FeoA family protein [Archaeoglobus profundus DSM 5631]
MSLIPLAMLPEGAKGKVVNIVGGIGALRKLMAMGIVPGKEIRVLGRRGGAMLISINGTKFVIGRGLAMKVMVDVGKEG